jgi:hypothetical protein
MVHAMKSNLVRYVHGQVIGKSFIISSHLWLEHLLVRSLLAKLPNPEALFRDRTLGFHMLVALCEALAIIEPNLGDALRLVNTMRNKCAHHARYKPSDTEFQAMRSILQNPDETLPSIEPEGWEPLIVVAELLERRARAVGATDLEAILPEGDDTGV